MLAEIRDRLLAKLTDPRWAGVEIAEDRDALAELAGQVESGTAIIMPWQEGAAPQALSTGGFRQDVEVRFVASFVIRYYSASMGEERVLQFDAYKTDLEQALAGWEPPSGTSECELIAGESSPVAKGVSIYVETWKTTRFLTGEAT
nr:hypothetical protein [uncultured Celeribacter sp.]